MFIIATSASPQYIIYAFLIIEQVHIYLLEKNEYIKILINRDSSKYKIKVHNKKDLFKDRYNYYLKDDDVLKEEQLCKLIISSSIKNNT